MKKIFGAIVVIVIFMVWAMIDKIFVDAIANSIRNSIENISEFQYVSIGITLKLIPVLIALWLIKLSWVKITTNKETEIPIEEITITDLKSSEQKELKNNNEYIANTIDEDRLYEKIWAEIDNGNIKMSLWAKLFSEYGGDNDKTKAQYIKIRVEELKHEIALKNSSDANLVPPKSDDSFKPTEEKIQKPAKNISQLNTATNNKGVNEIPIGFSFTDIVMLILGGALIFGVGWIMMAN